MVHKPLLRPYFWGGCVRGGRLTSHDRCNILAQAGLCFRNESSETTIDFQGQKIVSLREVNQKVVTDLP